MLSPQFQAFVAEENKFHEVADIKIRIDGTIEWVDVVMEDGKKRRLTNSKRYLLRHVSKTK